MRSTELLHSMILTLRHYNVSILMQQNYITLVLLMWYWRGFGKQTSLGCHVVCMIYWCCLWCFSSTELGGVTCHSVTSYQHKNQGTFYGQSLVLPLICCIRSSIRQKSRKKVSSSAQTTFDPRYGALHIIHEVSIQCPPLTLILSDRARSHKPRSVRQSEREWRKKLET